MVFCNESKLKAIELFIKCHNPYFNRWFSAIKEAEKQAEAEERSQSLF